jgi:hypothetical protein
VTRVVVVIVAGAVALMASACDQCVLRPCGFCYDSVISATARENPHAPKPPPPSLLAPPPSAPPTGTAMAH